MSRRGHFSRDLASRIWALLNGKERLSVASIKEKEKALLGGLRHRVHTMAIAIYCDERRRRREVAVPDVMMHTLKVPKALPGFCIERKQGVGEKIVANAIRTVEIENR